MTKRRNTTTPPRPPQESPESIRRAAASAAAARGAQPATVSDGELAGHGLTESIRAALIAKKTYDNLANSIAPEAAALASERAKLTTESAAVAEDRQSLRAERADLKELTDRASSNRAILDEREMRVALSEAQAEAGFLGRRDEILGPIREKIVQLTESWHAQERSLLSDWDEKLRVRRAELDAEAIATRTSLDTQRGQVMQLQVEVDARTEALDREGRRLTARREVLDEDERAIHEERASIELRVAHDVEQIIKESEAKSERLMERIAEFEVLEAALEQFRRDLGSDPTRAIRRIEQLETERTELRQQLDARPPVSVREELDAAHQRLRTAESERSEAQRARRELEQQIDYQLALLAEHDQLELTNEALSAAAEAYKFEMTELRAQFEQLTSASSAQTAFPECRAMDSNPRYRRVALGRDPQDLAEFIEELQVRMAHDAEAKSEGRQLNYRKEDLRIFLAGLAMSRLHLLEGVSGTGKTTLPRAFANAIHAGVKTIEVQAGWRDRQDLLGYYNSFERVYRESECLQWLYRAHLPAFRDRPVFLILDEMNLSHPEQYFADFLSVLENPTSPISLVDRQLPDVPEFMLTAAGVQLALARNVWFIGTANQDETTYGFAPKTYDRAHVMSLKPNAPPVTGTDPGDARPVSLSGLESSFRRAQRTYVNDAKTARDFVAALEGFFNKKFRVGWGHRMNDHIDKFVPVNIAADGSLGEGLDHIVATKLVKKIAGRHSLRRDSLEELLQMISVGWPDPSRGPQKTTEAIQGEIDELSYG